MKPEELMMAFSKFLSSQTVAEDDNKSPKAISKVAIVPNEEGLKVTPYEGNPDLGYIQVEEIEIKNSSLTWKRTVRRTALIKGDVKTLKAWSNGFKGGVIPGKIVVLEYTEDELPENIEREFFGDPDSERYDELKERAVKRSGNDGIELTFDGQLIYRFQVYDEFDQLEDKLIDHDNSTEVRAFAKRRREKERAEAEAKAKKEAEELAKKADADKKAAEKAAAKAEKEAEVTGEASSTDANLPK